MKTVSVKAHPRSKPSKPQVYIDKHAQLRAEIEEARAPKTLFQWVRHYHRKVMELAGGRT